MRPGQMTTIRVDLKTNTATVERQEARFFDRLIYLHRSPGPHNVAIRGNWIFTKIWMWLMDGLVSVMVFLSASGIYLWTVLKAERKIGLVLIGLGSLVFFSLVSLIVL